MGRKIASLLVAICFLMQGAVCFADGRNLAHLYRGEEIKVFVKSIVNESEKKDLSVPDFKKEVEKAFTNRRSVDFEVVSSAEASDVEVAGVIKQYQYLVKGPMKPSLGIETTALDIAATMTENYADMNVSFTITDSKTGKVLWTNDIYEYEKKVMTEGESIPIMFDKIARKFVVRSFGKPARK
ncbi:MAG: hypothetical protein WC779_07340 [Candidatus Omnitrophota bacterium]